MSHACCCHDAARLIIQRGRSNGGMAGSGENKRREEEIDTKKRDGARKRKRISLIWLVHMRDWHMCIVEHLQACRV